MEVHQIGLQKESLIEVAGVEVGVAEVVEVGECEMPHLNLEEVHLGVLGDLQVCY